MDFNSPYQSVIADRKSYSHTTPHAPHTNRQRKRRRKRLRRRQPISLLRERHVELKKIEEEDQVPDGSSNVVRISLDNAWDCAPSIGWVLCYFVLVGMVAVSMRFCINPFDNLFEHTNCNPITN